MNAINAEAINLLKHGDYLTYKEITLLFKVPYQKVALLGGAQIYDADKSAVHLAQQVLTFYEKPIDLNGIYLCQLLYTCRFRLKTISDALLLSYGYVHKRTFALSQNSKYSRVPIKDYVSCILDWDAERLYHLAEQNLSVLGGAYGI